MLTYLDNSTSISIELVILTGGIVVTGRTPYVEIRNNQTNQYFDFTTRTFNAAPVTTTGDMASAIDGLYRYAWDVSGLFNTNHHLTFEYHDATAMTIESVWFTLPALNTADVSVNVAGGGGSTIVKGQWTKKEKERLFDKLDEIHKAIIDKATEILAKESLTKTDLLFFAQTKERDDYMYQGMLELLGLTTDATDNEFTDALHEYIESEKDARRKILDVIHKNIKDNELAIAKVEELTKPTQPKLIDEEDEE